MFSMYFFVLRSDSDSEGENPEKKKLQEQLMGRCLVWIQLLSKKQLHLRKSRWKTIGSYCLPDK